MSAINAMSARSRFWADLPRATLGLTCLLIVLGSGQSCGTAFAAEQAKHPRVTFHAKAKPLAKGAMTQNWTSFLGPMHNGDAFETKLLKQFPKGGPRIVWEMRKGTSYTSPAIQYGKPWGDQLVYLHRWKDEEIVECVHPATGDLHWQFKYPTSYRDRIGYNNGPRSSPVIDEDRVYTLGAQGQLHCLNLKTGKAVWKVDLLKTFKPMATWFGYGTTPLVYGPMLIVNVGAPEYTSTIDGKPRKGAAVVAFNKLTGKVVWHVGDKWGPSYASPVPATLSGVLPNGAEEKGYGRTRLFVFTGGEDRPPPGGLLLIDPVEGKLLDRFAWRSKKWQSVNAANPVVVGNQVFISATYQQGGALLNVTNDDKLKLAWKAPGLDMHWNTVIHKDGYLYGYAGRNEPDARLVCYDLKTGKEVWEEIAFYNEKRAVDGQERTMRVSPFRASLLHVDGKFLALGELGHLLWLDLTPKGYKELSRAWLFAAPETWSTPVISHGLLYISQHSKDRLGGHEPRLICYDLRGE